MSELSDKQLLTAFLHGNREGFDVLFRRYAPRIHATAFRLTGSWEDAEDTLQEVFLQLARKASTIRNRAALSAWLYRTAVNRATDSLRRRKQTVSLDDNPIQAEKVIWVESLRLEKRQQRSRDAMAILDRIQELILRLPPRQAAIFVLKGFQGLTHREIAEVLGCSESGSKSQYCVACAKIREYLEKESCAEETRGEKMQ